MPTRARRFSHPRSGCVAGLVGRAVSFRRPHGASGACRDRSRAGHTAGAPRTHARYAPRTSQSGRAGAGRRTVGVVGRVTAQRRVLRVDVGTGARRPRADSLAVEEPLEIRVGGRPVSVTMRTPGDDLDLAHGFLLTEGLIPGADAVVRAIWCASPPGPGGSSGPAAANTYNVLDVTLAPGVVLPELSLDRSFYTTSSCGVCGKASIDAIRTRSPYDVAVDGVVVDPEVLTALPDRLRAAQRVFDRTGGLHAAGLFTADGELLCLREDVGRHNAVDKVVGWAAREGRLPLRGCVLLVSGRASFELAQKAVVAGIPVLAAVSAPSSLAVELAAESGATLVGFLRGTSMNVYTGAQRIAHPGGAAHGDESPVPGHSGSERPAAAGA